MRVVATGDGSTRSRSRSLAASLYADVTAAVANLTDDVLGEAGASIERASDALARLRDRMHATHAILWLVEGTVARRVLRTGPGSRDQGYPLDLDGRMPSLDRLRRNGTLFCGLDEVSGIEELAPEGVSAFLAAAAAQGAGTCSVLVLGWTDAVPERDTMAFAPLRIAAALLGRAVTAPHPARQVVDLRVTRAIDALPALVWVADTEGRLIHASRQWTEACARSVAAPGTWRWVDALHADDRERAEAVFAAAVGRREGFELDLRLWSHGAYSSFGCVAAPVIDAGGGVESYVGVCVDTAARHRAESAADDIAGRLLAAQEAERSRIARDLHDDLGQQVTLLEATIEAALGRRGPSQARSVLMATRTKLREIAASIHTLAYSLHPAKLKLLGLVQTLQTLCRDVAAEAGQDVRFAARDIPSDIDEDVVLCIFRVAQEALQNALKHSGARTIDVDLSATGQRLTLRVVDDGSGFDPDGPRPGGLGLLTMRERVEMVGGALTVITARGHGTTIEASVDAKRAAVSV
jgi:signal transduction histidine kinase